MEFFFMSFDDFLYEFKCVYLCRLFDNKIWKRSEKIEVIIKENLSNNFKRASGKVQQQLVFLQKNLILVARYVEILNMGSRYFKKPIFLY